MWSARSRARMMPATLASIAEHGRSRALTTRFRAMNDAPMAATGWQPVRYCVDTDTMAVEIRPWPGREDDDGVARDAGVDLVIHYAPDGQPWLWEIEHASRH